MVITFARLENFSPDSSMTAIIGQLLDFDDFLEILEVSAKEGRATGLQVNSLDLSEADFYTNLYDTEDRGHDVSTRRRVDVWRMYKVLSSLPHLQRLRANAVVIHFFQQLREPRWACGFAKESYQDSKLSFHDHLHPDLAHLPTTLCMLTIPGVRFLEAGEFSNALSNLESVEIIGTPLWFGKIKSVLQLAFWNVPKIIFTHPCAITHHYEDLLAAYPICVLDNSSRIIQLSQLIFTLVTRSSRRAESTESPYNEDYCQTSLPPQSKLRHIHVRYPPDNEECTKDDEREYEYEHVLGLVTIWFESSKIDYDPGWVHSKPGLVDISIEQVDWLGQGNWEKVFLEK